MQSYLQPESSLMLKQVPMSGTSWQEPLFLGVSLRITTVQRRQFEAQLFQEVNNILGSKHFRTTAYHPQANGLVERLHRQMKAAILYHVTERWTEVLPFVMLGIRSAWRKDLEATPADLVFGQALRLPGEFLASCKSTDNREPSSDFAKELRQHLQHLRPVSGTRHAIKTPFVLKDLATSKSAWPRLDKTRRALQQPYQGPYQIIRRGEKKFDLRINGQDVTVSINRLKPTYTLTDKDEPHEPKADHSARVQQQENYPVISKRRVRFPDRHQGGFS
ncbi:uncharacterized protein LOC117171038 [Belonocnema kinseyi]|uniref:uncharacterized protein LOC117171038 n=1 Tax=Belonocnema kinseyi TaxID=2817044 RepID=UPI00143D3B8B|nr:uncharacterized protein LOC117171038 [Belonocnema kinseyi]